MWNLYTQLCFVPLNKSILSYSSSLNLHGVPSLPNTVTRAAPKMNQDHAKKTRTLRPRIICERLGSLISILPEFKENKTYICQKKKKGVIQQKLVLKNFRWSMVCITHNMEIGPPWYRQFSSTLGMKVTQERETHARDPHPLFQCLLGAVSSLTSLKHTKYF